MRAVVLATLLGLIVIGMAGCKKDTSENESKALLALGEGATTYFQEEHPDAVDPMKVTTRVYPVAVNPTCVTDGKPASADEALFTMLRYKGESGLEVCYQSKDDGSAFRAWTQVDGKIHLCLQGTNDNGTPKLSTPKEVEGQCEMP